MVRRVGGESAPAWPVIGLTFEENMAVADAAGVGDPWIARALAEARSSVVEYVARCLTARYPTLTDHQARARELVMTSEGATQAVFLGWATSDQAYATINQALDRAKKTSRTDA